MSAVAPPPYAAAGRPLPESLGLATVAVDIEMLPQHQRAASVTSQGSFSFPDVSKAGSGEWQSGCPSPQSEVDKLTGGLLPPSSPQADALQLHLLQTKIALAQAEAEMRRVDRDRSREEESAREERLLRLQAELKREEREILASHQRAESLLELNRDRLHAQAMAFHSKATVAQMSTVAPTVTPTTTSTVVSSASGSFVAAHYTPWYRRCWVWTVVSIVGIVVIVIASVAGAANSSSNSNQD